MTAVKRSLELMAGAATWLLGTDPRPAPPHVFLLDSASLRYGRFVAGESGFEVEDLTIAEMPRELFGDGPLGGVTHDLGLFKQLVNEIVATVDEKPEEASLVLPDAWLRLSFAELEDLPARGARRLEALRWKLKRQVPFPIDDLRLKAVSVARLPNQEEPRRVLIGFGVEALFRQLEEVFAASGVRIGRILNTSLATVSSIREVVSDLDLALLVLVSAGGYSLTFTQRGEPLLHRFRALDTSLRGEDAAQLVVRDLKLTRSFVEEQLPERELARVLLASPERQRRFWLDSLEDALGRAPVALEREQLPLRGTLPEVSPVELAPMVGAAWRDVA